MSRASLDKDPHEVSAMFDGVASGYDRANSFMTFGFDRRWRTTTARVLDARRGEKVLDLAAGTGVSTVEYARGGVLDGGHPGAGGEVEDLLAAAGVEHAGGGGAPAPVEAEGHERVRPVVPGRDAVEHRGDFVRVL